MATLPDGMHEVPEDLSPSTRDMHRAWTSLREELEAVDWYQQRAEAATDSELRDILHHNMEEELEHAMMVLEWLRRRVPALDRHMRAFLFSEGPLGGHPPEEDAPG